MTEAKGPLKPVPLDSWTGKPCRHDGDDLGRYEDGVCFGCGTHFAEKGGSDA